MLRVKFIVSKDEELEKELKHVKSVLTKSGYIKQSWGTPESSRKTSHPGQE